MPMVQKEGNKPMTKEINKLWLVVNIETNEAEKIFVSKNAALHWKQTHDINDPTITDIYCVMEFCPKESQ